MKRVLITLFIVVILLSAGSVFAQYTEAPVFDYNSAINQASGITQTQTNAINQVVSERTTGLVGCTGTDCNFASFVGMINNFIQWILRLSISIGAISFAYAGYLILFHPDSPGERQKALEIFKKTVYGLLILLCSWLIVYLIVNNLASTSGNFLRYLSN